ncbi:MAG: hypothetical protein ABIB79_00675 [archaeon]
MRETNYGIISDIHEDPRIVPLAIDVLKSEGTEKLLVNGDIGRLMPGRDLQEAIGNAHQYTGFILRKIGESGLDSYVQPGSHETLLGFEPVAEWARQFKNITLIDESTKIEQNGHDLVFLPGSDFLCGGEYKIGNDNLRFSGRYFGGGELGRKFSDWRVYLDAINQGWDKGAFAYANMNSLKRIVTNPEKTVIVCHIPRKFNNLETAVDVAEFVQAEVDFVHNGRTIKKGAIRPAAMIDPEAYPVKVRKENRGNVDLGLIYDEIGLTEEGIAFPTGHFHESGHRACDKDGNHIAEGEFTKGLYWNSGHLDVGQTGVLTIKDGKASYQNINLRDYLK